MKDDRRLTIGDGIRLAAGMFLFHLQLAVFVAVVVALLVALGVFEAGDMYGR